MEESHVKRARSQGNHLESEISWRKKRCATSPKRGVWKTEDGLPKEKGDFIREYKAMHEEHFSVVGDGTTQKVKPKK